MKLDIKKVLSSFNLSTKDPFIAGLEVWKKAEEERAQLRSLLIDQEARLFQANLDWDDLHKGLSAAQVAKANATTIRAIDDACWAAAKRRWRAEEAIKQLKEKLANL